MKKQLTIRCITFLIAALISIFNMETSRAQTYIVTFNMVGHGDQVPPQNVPAGGYITQPEDPEDDIWIFMGWYPEPDMINQWDFSNMTVNSDMILYAAWYKYSVPVCPEDTLYETPFFYNTNRSYGIRVYPTSHDLFIGNDFMELGLHRNGAFGTYDYPPSNFHPWTGRPNTLGLRSSKSGWGTGDDPHGTYTRDFFTPATVDEGWMISENGSAVVIGQCGTNANMNGVNLTGATTTVKIMGIPDSLSESIATKTIISTSVGYEIKQVIMFKKDDTGYDTWVTVRNTSSYDKTNVKYYRAFDPDQPATPFEDYKTDNYYHTEPNGDVYVLASAVNSYLPTYTTLEDMFDTADGAFFFYAPASTDDSYIPYPGTQIVGWMSAHEFSIPYDSYHHYADIGISVIFDLGTIPAGGEKTLYYYSSLDPDAARALEKLKVKTGERPPAPVFTSNNVTPNDVVCYMTGDSVAPVTLKEIDATSGRIYLVNKICETMLELSLAENQLVAGKLCDTTGSVAMTLIAEQGGPYYAYYVNDEGAVSHEREFYIAPKYDITFTDTICHGENYTENGFNIAKPSVGEHTDSLTLSTFFFGCDSIVRLFLTVTPAKDTIIQDMVCFGNGYHRNGFEIDSLSLEVGTNYDTLFLSTASGCDSIVYLELYVAPIYDTTFIDSICRNEGYHEHGFDLDSLPVGWHFDTINPKTVLGCDSIVYLELFVAPIYDTTFYDTICRNEGYNEHGFALDSLPVGWHFDTINPGTVLGCDSIVYLELYVAPIYDTTFIDTICRNEGYHEHGFDLDSLPVGWHFDTINPKTVLGCDSIVYLELYVAPIYDTTFYDTICRNESYHQQGFVLDSLPVGWHFDTINPGTVLGCDSLVYLELYVAPIYDTTFIDTICANEAYHQQGFVLDSLPVGWHFDTINPGTVLGCDSIVYLKLYVAPIYDTTFYDTICRNEGYHEHGFALDSLPVGWHFDTINPGTVLGCDSLVYLELYVAPIYDTTFYDTVCFGNGYHEHGFEIDSLDLEIGMNYDTLHLQTVIGCDSVVYLELLVGDVYELNFTDTTCVNEGYHLHGFELDNLELGWRYDTLFLSSIVGCDSTVTLELYVAPVFDTTFFDTICSGNNYFEHGFSIQSPNVGWNFDTLGLSTTLGCDSLVYLELYVAPTYDIVLFDSICFGEDYHLHGFDFESPGVGDHSETHESVTTLGCDSIVVMNLFVGEVYDIKLHDTVCFGDNYDNYNFHFVNPPLGTNSETQVLSSMHGCDSTVNLKLYVAPVYRFTVYDSICEGDDYTDYGLHITQPQPGMHSHTSILKTELGCDSIFDVNFKVIYTYKTPDTIYGLGSVYVSTDLLPGKYRYWIDTITGCNDYYWEIDNDKWVMYPDRNECTIIVTTPEVTTLTVRAGNSCGEVSKSIEIHAGYFGVDENETVKASVYPNPSNGYVNVEADGIEAVNILGATGVVVKSYKFERENLVSIDISDMPNSIYVLEIVTRDGRCIRRITKTGY